MSIGSGTPRELLEEAMHESHSEFCFEFSLDPIASNAGQKFVATALKICSWVVMYTLPGGEQKHKV